MRVRTLAAALWVAASFTSPAFAQAPLPVPYLPQTEALCGGAAAAMVMRFWGLRGVYAESFAPLVDRSAGGIHTSKLNSELRTRGWQTQAGGGDMPRLVSEIEEGRPVIALIEDRPDRYHYVVVVSASAAGPIVLHDPAKAPSRVMDLATFDRKWQKSDRWMLIAVPGPDLDVRATDLDRSSRPDPAPTACTPQVAEAVGKAQAGDTAGARRLLAAAATACPQDGAPRRELAGLDAIDKRWDAAAVNARAAVTRDDEDEHAWRILATAEYLRERDLDALDAWNRIGEPRADLVDIKGLTHTRYRVVSDAVGVQPGAVLTADAIRLAQKRAGDIPAVAAARVAFHPLEAGQAQVDVTILERARAPLSYPSWIALGVGALANRQAEAAITNVSGGGDVAEVSWRWWAHRPRIAAAYSAPGPGGIWRLELSQETQTFGAPRFEETRTRAGVSVGRWIDQRVRVGGGVATDRWRDRGRTVALAGRLEFWPVIDRLSVHAGVEGWNGGGGSFAAADARVQWRSRPQNTGSVLVAGGGYQGATSTAPASLWPGADTGHARPVLLRAHPLLEDGVIEGGVFGRRVSFASIEAQRWLKPIAQGLLRLAPAVFVDVARATHGLPESDRRLHTDVGAGVRLSLAGSGVLRVDVARGLRDGRTALSVGWQR